MHDLTAAAQAIEEEAGVGNAAAMLALLGVDTEDELDRIMAEAVDRAQRAVIGAIMEYGESRATGTYMLLCGIRTGLQLGIAAERLRQDR